jgi:hypothetical protein
MTATDGKNDKSSGGIGADRFFWALCFCAGLFMAACMALGMKNAEDVRSTWLATSGRVIDIEFEDGDEIGRTYYRAAVRYAFERKTYISKLRNVRHSVKTGDAITFYRNPKDPTDIAKFEVGERGNFLLGYSVIAVSCAVTLFAAVKIALTFSTKFIGL